MKKVFILLVIAVLTVFQAQAVLKEKDLPQTLGVLRAELAQAYNEQQAIMARFEKRNVEQHSRLVHLMQSSNQIALMLFSQNSDFTLDMAYACQAATEQYRKLKTYHAPYDKMKERINSEIERYDALIKTLENLPPRVLPNGELGGLPDSVREMLPKVVLDTATKNLYILDKQGLEDREVCLDYAIALRDNFIKMLENVELDQEYYERVTERMGKLNAFAMSRYEQIQNNIFKNGGGNYFQTIKRLRLYYMLAKKDLGDRYKPFERKSEWRGPVIYSISVFMLFYIVVASLLSYVIMRWLLPRKWRARFKDQHLRGGYLRHLHRHRPLLRDSEFRPDGHRLDDVLRLDAGSHPRLADYPSRRLADTRRSALLYAVHHYGIHRHRVPYYIDTEYFGEPYLPADNADFHHLAVLGTETEGGQTARQRPHLHRGVAHRDGGFVRGGVARFRPYGGADYDLVDDPVGRHPDHHLFLRPGQVVRREASDTQNRPQQRRGTP